MEKRRTKKTGRPTKRKIKKPALKKAIDIAGGVTNLSLDIKVDHTSICKWLYTDRKIPSHHVPKIVKVTKGEIKPEELRPDVYTMSNN